MESEHRSAAARTCVGCRAPDDQLALLRVVGVGSATGTGDGAWRVSPDPQRREPGRGAYVHPDLECLQTALRRRAFGRALRRSGSPDTTEVVAYVQAQQQ